MKRFRDIRQNDPENFVLNNLVEEDVQSILLPLNLMQCFMFCPKYRIHNNLIHPNSLISNLVSLIGMLLFIIIYIYCTCVLFILTSHEDSSVFTSFIAVMQYFSDPIFFCVGFASNFVLGMINSKKNIKFVLTFQQVHGFLNNECSTKRLIIWNWIIITLFPSFYIFVYTYFFIRLHLPIILYYCMYLLIFMNCNVIYATRVIKLLEEKLALWNNQALNAQNIEETLRLRYCDKVFQTYVAILDCYNIIRDCFQSLLLYHIVAALLHSLGYIQMAIGEWKDGHYGNMDDGTIASMPLLMWVIKDVTCQTVLNRQCEKFYSALERVQDTCAIILKTRCSDEEKQMCKNVLRLHRASFSKIRVCGLLYLDAALQLSLMSLLTNYTVVLLQFAFL